MEPLLKRLSPTHWLTGQNAFKQVFAIALFAIQAPLLGPRAFGLMALVMVFIGFCEYVVEIMGTDSLISVKQIDAQHYSTMTTVNVVIAAIMGLLVLVFAEAIASMFHEPQLAPMLRVMAVLPVITVLASAPSAACRRELQFEPLVTRMVASTVAGGCIGLTLTFMHFGAWALIWQAVTQRLLSVVILWRLAKIPFRLGFSASHFHELRRYGAPMFVSQTMSWAADQTPRYVLGLFLGATELGFFSLASRLADIVLQLAVSPRYGVARIELRKFSSDNTAGLEAAVRQILTQMSMLTFPLCIGAAVVMPLLFETWLKSRWAAGVIPAQLMMLGIMPYVTHYGLSAALLGINRQSAIAINATAQTITLVLVSFAVAPFGLYAATAAIACRPLLTATIPVFFARRYCGIAPKSVLISQLPALLAAAVTGAALLAIRVVVAPYFNSSVALLGLMLSGIVIYCAAIAVLSPAIAAAYSTRLLALVRRPTRAN
jgi:O-antigen/teichoic acid export membrane protein